MLKFPIEQSCLYNTLKDRVRAGERSSVWGQLALSQSFETYIPTWINLQNELDYAVAPAIAHCFAAKFAKVDMFVENSL